MSSKIAGYIKEVLYRKKYIKISLIINVKTGYSKLKHKNIYKDELIDVYIEHKNIQNIKISTGDYITVHGYLSFHFWKHNKKEKYKIIFIGTKIEKNTTKKYQNEITIKGKINKIISKKNYNIIKLEIYRKDIILNKIKKGIIDCFTFKLPENISNKSNHNIICNGILNYSNINKEFYIYLKNIELYKEEKRINNHEKNN